LVDYIFLTTTVQEMEHKYHR